MSGSSESGKGRRGGDVTWNGEEGRGDMAGWGEFGGRKKKKKCMYVCMYVCIYYKSQTQRRLRSCESNINYKYNAV